MAVSPTHNGWRYDRANGRLDFYYRGTRVFSVDAAGIDTVDSTVINNVVQAAGIAAGAVTQPKLSTNLAIGHVPIHLDRWRLVATNDVPAIAVASGNGGNLASDTAPKLVRINGATDKGLRIQWAASSAVEIMADFIYPPDLDDTANVTFNCLAASGGATNSPEITVGYFEGLGDTDAGGNTDAVTGTTITQYTRTIAASDVGAYPNKASIQLTPGSHGTDVLNLYATWMTYTKKS